MFRDIFNRITDKFQDMDLGELLEYLSLRQQQTATHNQRCIEQVSFEGYRYYIFIDPPSVDDNANQDVTIVASKQAPKEELETLGGMLTSLGRIALLSDKDEIDLQ